MSTKKAYESDWKGWAEGGAESLQEGFQVPTTTTGTAVCPTGSITFPLRLAFTGITYTTYEDVVDDIIIDIQYGSYANPPTYQNGIINVGEDTSRTSLLYTLNKFKYNLTDMRIAAVSHNSWLLNNKEQNRADIVLYFTKESTNLGGPDYIGFIIPIIQSTTYTGSNKFLQGLYNKNLQGPFTVRDCFPEKDTLFLRYSACLVGTGGAPKRMDVFVSSVGLPVSDSIMTSIKGNATVFPQITQPEGTVGLGTEISSAGTDFQNKISASRYIVEVAKSGTYKTPSQVVRADQTNAYKCLPFDPDGEITDGKIRVDLDSGLIVNAEGEALSNVLEARGKVRAEDKGKLEGVAPGNWEKGITITLAVIFCILAIGLFGMMFYIFFKGGGDTVEATVEGPQGFVAAGKGYTIL